MRRERVFDLLLNSCVRTQVSNEERERVFDLLLTAASGLRSVMRRESV